MFVDEDCVDSRFDVDDLRTRVCDCVCLLTCWLQFLATLLITMQLVQQVQESLIPYLVYKMRHISIRTGYFVINTATEKACVSDQTLLRGEVEKAKDKYQVVTYC